MTTNQHTRRNFLSSIAILSAGTALGSAIRFCPSGKKAVSPEKKWIAFWKRSGGHIIYTTHSLHSKNNNEPVKGHCYKQGEVIYFPKENILAQPTWIFWKNDCVNAADVVVTLFENDTLFTKIIFFNRYEMEALYQLSKHPGAEELLSASFNNSGSVAGTPVGKINTRICIKENSQEQYISYYKGPVLVYEDKLIHHHI